jgi:hypothetical protein
MDFFPYDGITRTGSKGLSQPRRHRRKHPLKSSPKLMEIHFSGKLGVSESLLAGQVGPGSSKHFFNVPLKWR